MVDIRLENLARLCLGSSTLFSVSAGAVVQSRTMRKVIDIFIFVASITAAVLWFWSASVSVPVPTWQGLGPGGDFLYALNRAAHLNQCAAFATGMAVLIPLAGHLLRKH